MNPELYRFLVHAHSVGRWIVLLLLIFAILNSLIAGRRPYLRTDNRLGLLLTISADLMLLLGIALYFLGEWGYKAVERVGGFGNMVKNPDVRYFTLEHSLPMLIAIVLMHIGKAQGKKAISDKAKHRRTVIFYLVALLIILVSIPWPFLKAGRGWF